MTTWLRWARMSLACGILLHELCSGEWWEPYPDRLDDGGPCRCRCHPEWNR